MRAVSPELRDRTRNGKPPVLSKMIGSDERSRSGTRCWQINGPCPRCVMTTLEPERLAEGPEGAPHDRPGEQRERTASMRRSSAVAPVRLDDAVHTRLMQASQIPDPPPNYTPPPQLLSPPHVESSRLSCPGPWARPTSRMLAQTPRFYERHCGRHSTAGRPKSRLWSICSSVSRSPTCEVAGIVSPKALAGSGSGLEKGQAVGQGGCAGRERRRRSALADACAVCTSAGSRYQERAEERVADWALGIIGVVGARAPRERGAGPARPSPRPRRPHCPRRSRRPSGRPAFPARVQPGQSGGPTSGNRSAPGIRAARAPDPRIGRALLSAILRRTEPSGPLGSRHPGQVGELVRQDRATSQPWSGPASKRQAENQAANAPRRQRRNREGTSGAPAPAASRRSDGPLRPSAENKQGGIRPRQHRTQIPIRVPRLGDRRGLPPRFRARHPSRGPRHGASPGPPAQSPPRASRPGRACENTGAIHSSPAKRRATPRQNYDERSRRWQFDLRVTRHGDLVARSATRARETSRDSARNEADAHRPQPRPAAPAPNRNQDKATPRGGPSLHQSASAMGRQLGWPELAIMDDLNASNYP